MTKHSSKPFTELSGVEQSELHGLPCLRVQTAAATGLVYLQGAHIAEWTPRGQSPVLWMSGKASYQSGKPLRGGVPICFPWFGPHPTHQEYPQHGFARTTDFAYVGARLDGEGRAELEFMLGENEKTRAFFPHAFEARLRVAFGQTLGLAFSVTNRGSASFDYEEALHTYFHVADVRKSALIGLRGAKYLDKVRGMAEFSESADALTLSGETDRVYESAAACTIADPLGRRSLVVEKAHSQNTVVWNPWAEKAAKIADFEASDWPKMLCVESANVGRAKVSLAPGTTHTLELTIRVGDVALGRAINDELSPP
ncbi:MAG TPA: D-hexose-6-phosphate mutarotase [Polyangiaceae bacterium]|jgi:glucose-6-phosphate 1-epimerase